ncbi:protein cueball isoform X1 [Vespula pensylvanica]|uniref:protein cueball isoform X1 n=1 Tax=Vespula pensylvanica TaxID=30213 RepID=UPI001CB9F8F6|nr:protein cueball isoform X1 [Vespula pensylvanica]
MIMSRQSRDFLTAFVFFIVLAVFTITSDARSWDIAVVIGDEIDFFSRNQTLTGEATVAGAVSLTGIAYDDKTRTLYLSDTRNNISIFSNDLTKKNLTSKPLLKKQDGTHIVAIAFDTSSRTLFWSDALKRLIMKMRVPMNGPPEEPVLLHNLTQIPRGIVLDMCNSHVYWTNSDNDNPTIERSNMDGTNRTIIIRGNLYEPMGLAIDHDEGKLYWSDDEEGIHVKIERSNLDGTEREIVLHNRNQQPVYLTVDKDFIYWSDWVHKAIWMMPKNTTNPDSPVKFKSYRESNRDADPNAVIARDNVGTIDCLAILKRRLEKKKLPEKQRKGPLLESYNNLTTSTEEVEPENFRLCLNGGSFDRIERSCRCKSGYTGSICETSLCQNYCLHGDCIVNSFGEAECKCIGTFTGKRCERDICEGYCLHDGECSLQNNMPFCKCKYSKGGRCEILADMPTVNVDTFSCRLICTENNHTSEKMLALDENCESKTLLFVLIALIIVLIILILVMSFYLHKLRRRPRIKKRFVVSKGGITPLTSRPQLTDNQCEITIENCCNMNICETPCFEPKLRTPMSRSNNTKKDEKNSLLDNMEGNSC